MSLILIRQGVSVVNAVNALVDSYRSAAVPYVLPPMPVDSFEGRHAGQPATVPGRFGGDDVDIVVETVMSGPLSRGVASASRRAAVQDRKSVV